MKRRSNSIIWFFAVLAVAFATYKLAFRNRDGAPESPATSQAASDESSDEASEQTSAIERPANEDASSPVAQAPSALRRDETDKLGSLEEYDEFRDAVGREAPFLNEYFALSQKQLKTPEEQIAYSEKLQDLDIIEQSVRKLGESVGQNEAQKQARFVTMNYIVDAIAWTENPARNKIVEEFGESLRHSPPPPDHGALDRAEILVRLRAADPILYERVLKKQNPTLTKFIESRLKSP